MRAERVALLQQMPIFGGIRADILELLVENAEHRRLASWAFLFRENDPASHIFVIEKGRVVILKEHRQKYYPISRLYVGDCVGEMSLIDLSPRSASVVALEPSQFICLTMAALYDLRKRDLEQFTTIQLNLARELSRRLRATDQELFEARRKTADLEPLHIPEPPSSL